MSADPEREPPRDLRAELAAKSDSGEPYTLDDLLVIMAVLRTPVIGCPWDLEQNFATIAPYTIEEAYEVADAIARGDLADLKDELGDLLLQVVYHAQMAEEERIFAFADVADAISRKLIRRHPHVFGDERARNAAQVPGLWDRIKAEEAAAKASSAAPGGERAGPPSVLDGVPLALPALTRSVKIQRKAAKVGFDWTNTGHIFWKVQEEMAELEAEIDTGSPASLEEEFGDVLFVLANLARRLEIDPEEAMRKANAKFVRRFSHIERSVTESGRGFGESVTLAEMEALWNEAKALEKQPGP